MTAWVPLMEATAETGPIQVLPRAHRRGVMRHYGANVVAPGLTVHPDHIPSDTPEPVTVACSIGDALLFGHMMPHRSEANDSDVIRWGADLRYTPPEAGDWGPGEGGFLARSAKGVAEGYPDANGGVRASLPLRLRLSRAGFAVVMLLAPPCPSAFLPELTRCRGCHIICAGGARLAGLCQHAQDPHRQPQRPARRP